MFVCCWFCPSQISISPLLGQFSPTVHAAGLVQPHSNRKVSSRPGTGQLRSDATDSPGRAPPWHVRKVEDEQTAVVRLLSRDTDAEALDQE